MVINKKGKNSISFIDNICKHKYLYLMVLPAIVAVVMFSYIPMLGIIMAFKDYNVVDGILGSPWVGLDNFIKVFTYPAMLDAIKNSFIYGVVLVFGAFPFPIILALLFNELRNEKFKKVTQTITYMPHFLSWISVIGMFFSFLAIEGPFNQFMATMLGDSYEPVNILMESEYFVPVVFVSHIWKTVGWKSILFLAAIAGIDQSLYEAADVDGCGKFKQVLYITLPGIASTIVIVLIMSLGSIFKTSFEQIYGFQNVYTQEQTESIGTLIYRQGIENGKYSLATAFGISEGLVSLVLILTGNAISKKVSGMSIW